MTFQVGDRVRYVNNTATSCRPAIGCMGTVVAVSQQTEVVTVLLDEVVWDGEETNKAITRGFWKWEVVSSSMTMEQRVINKCQSLTSRFKNKQLKTKSKPLPFPKEVKYV